uniref:RRM domain-containing protein n=1 Tax=Globodera rostochiensis TaxID=31243 RepID=A0A914H7J6_GLORO
MSRRNETLDAKIYVGGLPEDATSEELDDVFHRFGRIRKIWVARRPPGFAFVEFEDVRDAEDAVRALDGTRICGVKARVELSHGGGRGGGGRGFRGGGGRHDDRHDRDRHDRDRRYRSSNSATATIPSCPPVLPVILPPCHSPQFSLKNVLPSTPSLLIHLLASLFLRTAGRTKNLALLAVLEAALLHFVNAVDPRATVVVRAPALVEIRQSIDDNGIKEGNDHDRNLRFYFNLCYLFYLITSSYDFMHRTSKSIRLLTAGPVVRSAPIFVGIESGII